MDKDKTIALREEYAESCLSGMHVDDIYEIAFNHLADSISEKDLLEWHKETKGDQ